MDESQCFHYARYKRPDILNYKLYHSISKSLVKTKLEIRSVVAEGVGDEN